MYDLDELRKKFVITSHVKSVLIDDYVETVDDDKVYVLFFYYPRDVYMGLERKHFENLTRNGNYESNVTFDAIPDKNGGCILKVTTVLDTNLYCENLEKLLNKA